MYMVIPVFDKVPYGGTLVLNGRSKKTKFTMVEHCYNYKNIKPVIFKNKSDAQLVINNTMGNPEFDDLELKIINVKYKD